jgi:hypothetical protein
MTGHKRDDVINRRQRIADMFKVAGWEVKDPTRGETVAFKGQVFDANAMDSYAPPSAIFRRDSADVRWCDVLLVDLEGALNIPSFGTVGEINQAWAHGKYIVVVGVQEGDLHDHLFVTEPASIQFQDMGDAVRYLTEVYGA